MRAASLRASAAFLRAADAAAALRFFFSTWAFLVAARASAAFWRASFFACSLAMRFSFLRWAWAAFRSEALRFESARACAAFLRDATLASRLRLAFSTWAARFLALAWRPFALATFASCWRFDLASVASFLSRAFSWA